MIINVWYIIGYQTVLATNLPKSDTNLELILFCGQGPKIYKAKNRSSMVIGPQKLDFMNGQTCF